MQKIKLTRKEVIFVILFAAFMFTGGYISIASGYSMLAGASALALGTVTVLVSAE